MSQLSLLLGFRPGASASDDEVHIRDKTVTVTTPEGVKGEMRLLDLMDLIQQRKDPLRDVCWPDGVRHVFVEWPMAVVVMELPAAVHRVKWISPRSPAPYGRSCVYDLRSLSLPYIVILGTFAWHPGPTGDGVPGGLRLTQRCEVFFRREPLRSLDDELLLPALLNASKYRNRGGRLDVPGKNIVWLCNQHMPISPMDSYPTNERLRQSITALAEYLLYSGFNYSGGATNSAAAAGGEECSFYEYQVGKKVDERISSVERWEHETAKDALFSLDVPFIPSGFSVREAAERIIREFNAHMPPIASAADLARLVLNRQQTAKNTQITYPHALWPTPT